jgi:hypothetical protein
MVLSPELIAGFCCGTIQTIVGHPLDTIKVILQNHGKIQHLKMNQLYRGVTFPLYKLIITNGISFDLRSKLKKNDINNEYLNGAIVGATIFPLVHLFDVLKIKQQNNMSYVFRDFFKSHSIFTSFLRETISNSVYLGSYFGMREYGINPLIAGGISGCINWTTTYPIDTIKTRTITYNNTIKECMLMGNYWGGYRVCIIRAFLVNSIGFGSYELSLKYLKNM